MYGARDGGRWENHSLVSHGHRAVRLFKKERGLKSMDLSLLALVLVLLHTALLGGSWVQ